MTRYQEYYARNSEKMKAKTKREYRKRRNALGLVVSPTGRHRTPAYGPAVLSREELAWAAGFVDGEGCFYIWVYVGKRHRHYRRYGFGIGQVDRRVLDRFVQAVGFGKVLGPYQQRNENQWKRKSKPSYEISITGFERVQAVMALLWTWLGPVKRQQAKSVLYGG